MVPVLIELRLVVAFKARRHKKICGMEGKEEAAQKEEASSSGTSYLVGCCSSYLVGWFGWLLPLKHDVIRGSVEWRAKKKKRPAAQVVLI